MTEIPSVSLRAPEARDHDLLFEIARDLGTWEERSERAPRPLSRARFDARLAQALEDDAADAPAAFVVDVDGRAVGSAWLLEIDMLARHAEVAISLSAEVRGQGIGTAAVRLLVDFAFVRHNLRRLHLQAIASNVAAIRAYEKAGFVVEGRQRDHAWVRGGYEDIVRMGILRGPGSAETAARAGGPGSA